MIRAIPGITTPLLRPRSPRKVTTSQASDKRRDKGFQTDPAMRSVNSAEPPVKAKWSGDRLVTPRVAASSSTTTAQSIGLGTSWGPVSAMVPEPAAGSREHGNGRGSGALRRRARHTDQVFLRRESTGIARVDSGILPSSSLQSLARPVHRLAR